MLKALGARNTHLYLTVLAQAVSECHARLFLWIGYHLVPGFGHPHPWGRTWRWRSAATSLVKVGSVSLVIAALSAMIPIRQITGLDPAMVFRGR